MFLAAFIGQFLGAMTAVFVVSALIGKVIKKISGHPDYVISDILSYVVALFLGCFGYSTDTMSPLATLPMVVWIYSLPFVVILFIDWCRFKKAERKEHKKDTKA